MNGTPDIDMQIACVEREIRQRAKVYPRWVEQEKMSKELADRETLRMNAVLATLKAVRSLVCGPALYAHENTMAIIAAAPLPPQGSLL